MKKNLSKKFVFHPPLFLATFLISNLLGEQASAADNVPASQVILYDNQSKACTVTASNVERYKDDCGQNFNRLIVVSLPSTSLLSLSSKNCAEEESTQDWWVRLKATRLLTSSKELSASGILASVERWLANPNLDYAAPDLKIVGGKINKTGAANNIGCAMITPTPTPGRTYLKTYNSQWKDSTGGGAWGGSAACNNQIITGFQGYDAYKFKIECSSVKDQTSDYVLVNPTTIEFPEEYGDRYCPDNKLLTGYSSISNQYGRRYTLTCAELKNVRTNKISKAASLKQSRGIRNYRTYTQCKTPYTTEMGVFVGLDGDRGNPQQIEFYCSAVNVEAN